MGIWESKIQSGKCEKEGKSLRDEPRSEWDGGALRKKNSGDLAKSLADQRASCRCTRTGEAVVLGTTMKIL